ncbi:MAG TPA: DUF3822 family protein [Phnomibacter sp.]|nr:DUF3822 family protein [Phnomibacter sp.]
MVAKSIDIGTSALAPFETGSRKLLIEWAPFHVHVLLWNTSDGAIEAIESFSGSIVDEEDWDFVVAQSRLFALRNLETLLVCAAQRMLPVPQTLFHAEQSQAELNLLLGTADWHQPMADLVPEKDMVLAWQVPQTVLTCLQKHFDILTVRHLAGELLKKPLQAEQPLGQLVLADKQALLLLHTKDGLLFAGMLPVISADDLAYRLLNICKQYDLPAGDTQWLVSGMIEKEAALYQGIEKYLQQITLWPVAIPTGEAVSPHYFAHLYTILS